MGELSDRVAAALGLILLLPLLAVVAAAIVMFDGRPIFFRHSRIGLNGKPFRLLKFRSMRRESGGPLITAGGDARVTPLGRWLRLYKIDEIPQLWNVLRGEMRLIGPRPEIPEFVNALDPLWAMVLRLKPGLTDLASLLYRNEEAILARSPAPEGYYRSVLLPDKLALTLSYHQARSAGRDVALLFYTIFYSLFPARLDPVRLRRMLMPAPDSR